MRKNGAIKTHPLRHAAFAAIDAASAWDIATHGADHDPEDGGGGGCDGEL
jgi:hypothetical protein